jgi:hypothetical protein
MLQDNNQTHILRAQCFDVGNIGQQPVKCKQFFSDLNITTKVHIQI